MFLAHIQAWKIAKPAQSIFLEVMPPWIFRIGPASQFESTRSQSGNNSPKRTVATGCGILLSIAAAAAWLKRRDSMSTIEVRAVVFGALSLLAGYVIWSAAITLLVSLVGISAPPGAWFLLTLFGAAGPVASGYVGARLAHSRRLLHGVLAAIAGTAVVLVILAAFTSFPNVYGVLSPIVISAFLSLAGAVLALHWPTRVAP